MRGGLDLSFRLFISTLGQISVLTAHVVAATMHYNKIALVQYVRDSANESLWVKTLILAGAAWQRPPSRHSFDTS
jgi:hypothetical protein